MMILSITILLILQLLIYFYLKNKQFHSYIAVQKIHDGDIPRIGGLIFFIGFIFFNIF